MNVRKFFILCCTAWILMLTVPVMAAGTYVTDNAGLLSEAEQADLEAIASELSAEWSAGFVILTEDGIGSENPFQYAADFYDYGGYPADGVILLLDMGERDWCIVTSGSCMDSVTDWDIERIGSLMVPYLSDGQYAMGFYTFLEETVNCLNGTYAGEEDIYDPGYGYDDEFIYNTNQDYYSEPLSPFSCVLTGGVIGLIIGLIVCLVMKSQMNTARPQFSAGYYLVDNSFSLTRSRDRFLYSNVTKVARPKEQNHSSGGSSGGFRSSSGRSHGGGGGKF